MFVSSWAVPEPKDTRDTTEMVRQIVWAYVVPKEDDSAAVSSCEASQLQNLVLVGIESWSPSLRNLVAKTSLSVISCFPLRSMPFLKSWVSTNITMLGDAIHNMTPMAGVGANTALRDAELLSEMLASASMQVLQMNQVVGRYESEMRNYANEAVGLSKCNAISASVGGGLQRCMFQMLLRAAQASPLIMRRTIARSVVTH